ncbi:MAG: GxxExxY protein [Planctomycetota bacterium]|nr:GxxExxY protein [Planctomycetota bacterium]
MTVCKSPVESQIYLPIEYDGIVIDKGYRIDLLVEKVVIVEVKSVDKLHPIHVSQVISYLKLSKVRVGLLMNFNVTRLKDGLKRIVHDLSE